MNAYLDNVIVSGKIRSDLEAKEMEAVTRLYDEASRGRLQVVTSRESWREQERTRNSDARAQLLEARGDVPVVQNDHRLLGFSYLQDQYGGFIANPLVTDVIDEPLFATFREAGLRDADARHLMYAVGNNCDRFVTVDPDFLDRRALLEGCCRGLRIVRPSELVAELSQRSS